MMRTILFLALLLFCGITECRAIRGVNRPAMTILDRSLAKEGKEKKDKEKDKDEEMESSAPTKAPVISATDSPTDTSPTDSPPPEQDPDVCQAALERISFITDNSQLVPTTFDVTSTADVDWTKVGVIADEDMKRFLLEEFVLSRCSNIFGRRQLEPDTVLGVDVRSGTYLEEPCSESIFECQRRAVEIVLFFDNADTAVDLAAMDAQVREALAGWTASPSMLDQGIVQVQYVPSTPRSTDSKDRKYRPVAIVLGIMAGLAVVVAFYVYKHHYLEDRGGWVLFSKDTHSVSESDLEEETSGREEIGSVSHRKFCNTVSRDTVNEVVVEDTDDEKYMEAVMFARETFEVTSVSPKKTTEAGANSPPFVRPGLHEGAREVGMETMLDNSRDVEVASTSPYREDVRSPPGFIPPMSCAKKSVSQELFPTEEEGVLYL